MNFVSVYGNKVNLLLWDEKCENSIKYVTSTMVLV